MALFLIDGRLKRLLSYKFFEHWNSKSERGCKDDKYGT